MLSAYSKKGIRDRTLSSLRWNTYGSVTDAFYPPPGDEGSIYIQLEWIVPHENLFVKRDVLRIFCFLSLYHWLTRAHTPDNVRRSLRRSASALRQKLALSNLLLPFPCKPTSLGFAWSAQGTFCPFCLDGLRHICVSKAKNHSKIQSCQVRSSFAGAEMRSSNEKPAGNTLCIGKGFEAAWAFFCPSKPCVSLSIDGK